MRFTKMHGSGNDYIYVNCHQEQVADASALARAISDRHRGVGSDGLILICPSQQADVRMEMYNADGSRAQMCGNGIRCVAKYAFEHRLSGANPMAIETDAGILAVDLTVTNGAVSLVRVDMGVPRFAPSDVPVATDSDQVIDQPWAVGDRAYRITCVSMGNPHVVIFVADLKAVNLSDEGSSIENHELFPERTNVHFVQVAAADQARMLSWERGSGATLACGTGACAVGVAGAVTKRLNRRSTIHLPGGALEIEWADDEHVYMTGPAVEVFSGEWSDARHA